MTLSSFLVSAPLAALLVTLLGAPALPAFSFAAAALLLALAHQDYSRVTGFERSLSRPRIVSLSRRRTRRARLPLAA